MTPADIAPVAGMTDTERRRYRHIARRLVHTHRHLSAADRDLYARLQISFARPKTLPPSWVLSRPPLVSVMLSDEERREERYFNGQRGIAP